MSKVAACIHCGAEAGPGGRYCLRCRPLGTCTVCGRTRQGTTVEPDGRVTFCQGAPGEPGCGYYPQWRPAATVATDEPADDDEGQADDDEGQADDDTPTPMAGQLSLLPTLEGTR